MRRLALEAMGAVMRRRPSPALVLAALALLISLSGVGVAATGGTFILGQGNSADHSTVLSGNVAGAQLQVNNDSSDTGARAIFGQVTSDTAPAGTAGVVGQTASVDPETAGVLGINTGGGPGLRAQVLPGVPPLRVNSRAKVVDLNADLLDGFDSTAFLPATGTAANSSKLEGHPASYFLPATGTAADSAKLGGLDPTAFMRTGTAAGGSLAGTYPNPTIADDAIGIQQLAPAVHAGTEETVPFMIERLVQAFGRYSGGASVDVPIYSGADITQPPAAPLAFEILQVWIAADDSSNRAWTWSLRGANSVQITTTSTVPDVWGACSYNNSCDPVLQYPDFASVSSPRGVAKGGTLSVHLTYNGQDQAFATPSFYLYILARPI